MDSQHGESDVYSTRYTIQRRQQQKWPEMFSGVSKSPKQDSIMFFGRLMYLRDCWFNNCQNRFRTTCCEASGGHTKCERVRGLLIRCFRTSRRTKAKQQAHRTNSNHNMQTKNKKNQHERKNENTKMPQFEQRVIKKVTKHKSTFKGSLVRPVKANTSATV